MPGVRLVAGAPIALARDDRRVGVLLAQARETGARVTIRGAALAQVVRAPAREVRLAVLSASRPPTSSPLGGLTPRASSGFWLRPAAQISSTRMS
jgi:hypothetical protein